MKTGKVSLAAFAWVILMFGVSAVRAENTARVQILSATVRDQKIDGATVILQKNGEQSSAAQTDLQGQAQVSESTARDPSTLLIVRKQGYSDLVAKCPCAGMTYASWPYCYDMDQATPVWAGAKAVDCRSAVHEKPVTLLPPHSAPLGALYYSGPMFPALEGKLLMSWHGYRPTGSRIVAFDVDAAGVPIPSPGARYPEYADGRVTLAAYRSGPAAEPKVLTPGWDLKPGVRPAGAPVGITVAHDGAIWVADDRNATILRIAADRQ